jgi:hypothetical protein
MEIAFFTALGLSGAVALFMVAFGILMARVFPLDTPPGES